MPTRNVNLTKHFDDFIENGVASGRFSNASEVVREALRLLEKKEKEDKAWVDYLTAAAQEAIDEIERGEYFEFETPEELNLHMKQLLDQAIKEARRGSKTRKTA